VSLPVLRRKLMYWNDLSQPYAVGERVQVKEAVSKGRLGHVTAVRPENAFSGEDALPGNWN
jgi:hypothetical protein